MLRVRSVLMSWCTYLGMDFPSRSACRVNRQVLIFSFPLWAAGARASSASPRARVRRFSFFAFTSSPAGRNSFVHSAIRVKAFVLRPSRFASLSSEKAQCHLSCFEICINADPKLPIRVKGLVKIRVKGKGPFCEKPSPLIHWPIARCKGWVKRWRQKTKSSWHVRVRARGKRAKGGTLRRRSMYKIPYSNLLEKDARSTKKDGVFFAFPSLFCLCRVDAVRNNPDERCTSPTKCLFL